MCTIIKFPYIPKTVNKDIKVDVDLFDLHCPHCGAPEVNPMTDLLNIRAYKVEVDGYWYSHCLCCGEWF